MLRKFKSNLEKLLFCKLILYKQEENKLRPSSTGNTFSYNFFNSAALESLFGKQKYVNKCFVVVLNQYFN